jgi:xanthine dehydrogenase YagR molybdenum-binding subunit
MTAHNPAESAAIGASLARIDGPLKVSGGAMYTSDHHFPGMVYAQPVSATIASGELTALDTAAAAKMPGVVKIFTHENIGPLYRISDASGASIDEKRPPLSDNKINYYGQYIALVVAESFEQATAAARAVKATYTEKPVDVSLELEPDDKPKVDSERGDPDTAFAKGEVKIDQVYRTPPETHNPIELHCTVATYDGRAYTVYETSQAIGNHKSVLVQMLGEVPENIRVVTEYLGSGFGGKLWPWTHSLLAVAAARDLKRPVKLEISRKMMFETVGHRTNTQQRIRIAATKAGRLTSIQQDYVHHVAQVEASKENCGEATPYFYSTPNLRVTSGQARRHFGPNTSMRGPGAVPGLYCTESAMDELAIELDICPVQLRLQNEPEMDESLGVPFSTRYYTECLKRGAEKFGWSKRNPEVGSMHADGEILGWGVAGASWMAKRIPAMANVQLNRDGTARVASATQDIGTGTYTVMAQMVANLTGIASDKIVVAIGDTSFPAGPMSGGSMATGSLVPAIGKAAREAIKQLLSIAAETDGLPMKGADPEDLTMTAGRVHRKSEQPEAGVPFEVVLQKAELSQVLGKGRAGASDNDPDADKHSIHSYGAHFVEVGWQPEIGRMRVRRVVTVIDAGKIINLLSGRNQIEGAIVMGVGMALFEETHYDSRNGAPINSNLADYVMVTHADSPDIDVEFLDYPDKALNELGARGIGEIGLAGVAAAITAAVYHATGVRVRDLPVHIDDLIKH